MSSLTVQKNESGGPGLTYGFVFDLGPDDAAAVDAGFPLASRPMVLFTDNMWRIDDDLRLREVSRIHIGSRGMRARLARSLTGTPLSTSPPGRARALAVTARVNGKIDAPPAACARVRAQRWLCINIRPPLRARP